MLSFKKGGFQKQLKSYKQNYFGASHRKRLLLVRHAWRITRWRKTTVWAGRCQALAKGKGVHREVESEGSLQQSSAPRNTNIIRHSMWDEFARQNEIQ